MGVHSFADRVVSRILALADEDGEDEVISNPDEGVAALREIVWE